MECATWQGKTEDYQYQAAIRLPDHLAPSALGWVTPDCDTTMCLTHLRVEEPRVLRYPHRICIYCGRHAATKDHLLPENWTGPGARRFVATVPACGTCNSVISDAITRTITERRDLCHRRLRRRFKKVLSTVDQSAEELEELGPSLRSYIESEMDKKSEVLRMLSWPEDPAFDHRALAASGVDASVSGLL